MTLNDRNVPLAEINKNSGAHCPPNNNNIFTIIVAFTGRVPWFSAIAFSHVTAVKISAQCVISAFER